MALRQQSWRLRGLTFAAGVYSALCGLAIWDGAWIALLFFACALGFTLVLRAEVRRKSGRES